MLEFNRWVALTILLLWVPGLNILVGGGILVYYMAYMVVNKRFLQLVVCFVMAFVLFGLVVESFRLKSYFLYALYCFGCVIFVAWSTAVLSANSKQALARLKKARPGQNYDFIFGDESFAGVDIQSKTMVVADRNAILEIPFSDIITFKHEYDWKPTFSGTKKYSNIRMIFETRRIATPVVTIYVGSVQDAEIAMARLKAVLT